MYCAKCGTEIPDDAVFCTACGSKTIRVQNAMPNVIIPETEKKSIFLFVCFFDTCRYVSFNTVLYQICRSFHTMFFNKRVFKRYFVHINFPNIRAIPTGCIRFY